MGYTVHQLCVNLMSHTFFAGDCSLYRSALTVKDFHLTADGLLYQPIRLADAVRHLTTDHFLTVKAIHGNFCVCRYDDAVRCGDFFRSQYIFAPAEPLVSILIWQSAAFAAFSSASAAI